MSRSADKLESLFEGFIEYMGQDTKGVEIGVYATSGILLAVAYHKIRPFTKLGRPQDIPGHFIRKKLPQRGYVERIEASLDGPYPLILVNHKPPLNVLFASKKVLPVRISGIEINSNGFSWLQTVVANRNVSFIPLSNEGKAAQCQLFVVQPDKPPLDVAKALLSIGFAKLEFPQVSQWDEKMLDYYENLLLEEQKAKKRRAGLWLFDLPQPSLTQRLLERAVSAVVPPAKRLPALVR